MAAFDPLTGITEEARKKIVDGFSEFMMKDGYIYTGMISFVNDVDKYSVPGEEFYRREIAGTTINISITRKPIK